MATISINGRDHAVSVPDDMPLLWLIRDHLQMTGTMPIHLVWTREDDIRGGRYRPMVLHKVRAAPRCLRPHRGLGPSHRSVVVHHRHRVRADVVKNGVDRLAIEGTADMPYHLDNLSVDWHQASSPVTTLWWRSVGHTHTAQVVEVMMDVLATEAKRDPVEFRLSMLKPACKAQGFEMKRRERYRRL